MWGMYGETRGPHVPPAFGEDYPVNFRVPKNIGDNRPVFKQLIIRNYEPPKTPLYTSAASQMPLLDLFGLEASYR